MLLEREMVFKEMVVMPEFRGGGWASCFLKAMEFQLVRGGERQGWWGCTGLAIMQFARSGQWGAIFGPIG